MSLTLESLADEVRPILNDIGLMHDFVLARIVGVADDEDDLYYLGLGMHGRRTYYSAVGACASLRAGLPADRYARLEEIFTLNGAPPVGELEIAHLEPTPNWGRRASLHPPGTVPDERLLERARWALACAYQAAGAALIGYTPGRPADQDIEDLLNVLSRWETYSEEQILSLLPWPKRWVRRGPDETLERLLAHLIASAAAPRDGASVEGALEEVRAYVYGDPRLGCTGERAAGES